MKPNAILFRLPDSVDGDPLFVLFKIYGNEINTQAEINPFTVNEGDDYRELNTSQLVFITLSTDETYSHVVASFSIDGPDNLPTIIHEMQALELNKIISYLLENESILNTRQ